MNLKADTRRYMQKGKEHTPFPFLLNRLIYSIVNKEFILFYHYTKSKPPVNWWFAQTLKGYNTGAPVNGYRNLATHHFSPAAAMSRLSFLPYLFLIPVNGSMYSLMLIWSCIWSSSNCLLIYSWITRSLRPTVST